ncbi:MAG: Ferritin Dps family protein [Bacteroidetes bacterium]|jgi:starvation-inducible DNA-binding protein|nr:Ferritin Dps family protein [Bacteroidota bacterium]
MNIANNIGLKNADVSVLSEKLNRLLANYQVFYMNARGFHWNIKGEKFFELHVKFEELYTNLQLKIDEIAERILTLGHRPLHSYSEYLKLSVIKEQTNVSDGKTALTEIIADFAVILPMQRELLKLAGDADDEGTNALMSDYIREQEKMLWMYNAYLNQ